MRGLNRIIVVGHVGQNPELRTSKSGLPWMTLSVATNRSVKRDDKWEEETDWHKVQIFGDTAERCMRHLRQGSMIGVEGTMNYEKWTDEEGVRRMSARVMADRVYFLNDFGQGARGEEPQLAEA